MSALEELLARVKALPGDARQQLVRDAAKATEQLCWVPNVGPQTDAYFCEADELFYGGQAGGGKSDLLIGLGLTAHRESLILRRMSKDAKSLAKRARKVSGKGASYNGQDMVLTTPDGRSIEFGGLQLEDDKERHKGRPHDLKGFDEIGDFSESQYTFVIGWNRSTVEGQRCRVVATGNPPTRPEGFWVLRRWAAWLDENHPRPAKPGELRWYTTDDLGNEIEVDGRGPHVLPNCAKPVLARSRTFIPSKVTDNPDLVRSGYQAQLDALPAELRAAYRDGNFQAEIKDDDWQVIPTAWIEAAMQRWTPEPPKNVPMACMAVDVAPGGGDQRVIGFRYDAWVGPLDAKKQVDKNGRVVAADVVRVRRHGCPVVVDVGGGWGGDALIALKDNQIDCHAFLGVAKSTARTRDRKLGFMNERAAATWKLREELDPEQDGGSHLALPPDPELKADLASYRWELTSQGIKIEDKEEIKKRIGRSPDKGDTVVMLIHAGNKAVLRQARSRAGGGHLPTMANRGYADHKG